MHILLGAIAGAGFALLAVAAIALVTGNDLTLKNLALAALGGAVAGAITTATLGATSTVGVGLGRQVVSFAVGGAAGGASERVADNAIEHRPLHDGVAEATAIGGAVGVTSLGTSKVLRHVGVRIFPAMGKGSPTSALGKLLGASTPGTGGGMLRGAGNVPGVGAGLRRAFGADDDDGDDARSAEPRVLVVPAEPTRFDATSVRQSSAEPASSPPPSTGLVGALR